MRTSTTPGPTRRPFVAAAAAVALAVAVPPAVAADAAVAAGATGAAAPGTPRIVDLGTLPGDFASEATAVNDRGVVVGTSSGSSWRRSFVWRAGRMTELAGLGGNTFAYDVNNHGVVVGSSAEPGFGWERAVLWRDGRLAEIGTLGGDFSLASGVNDAGVVVGWSTTGTGELHAFSWHRGVMTDLGTAGGHTSRAVDVNERGQVGGDRLDGMTTNPLLWTRGEPRVLLHEDATVSDVNDRGDVLGYTFGTAGSFVWSRGRVTWIPALAGGTFLQMQAINDRREVVGSGDFGTYLWRSGTLTELATLAGAGAAAVDINDRGTIAGCSASTPDGLNPHAVIWTR